MALFQKNKTVAELEQLIERFDAETHSLEARRSALTGDLSAALALAAGGEPSDAGRIQTELTGVSTSLSARPGARILLETELHQAQEREKAAELQQEKRAALAWLKVRKVKTDRASAALTELRSALVELLEDRSAAPHVVHRLIGYSSIGSTPAADALRAEAVLHHIAGALSRGSSSYGNSNFNLDPAAFDRAAEAANQAQSVLASLVKSI